jgi:chromosome segregation ATPase
LVLYLNREGGRVHGAVLPGSGLLLAATRHLTDVAVPGLAQQVRDSQRGMIRLVEEQERASAALRRAAEQDAASTMIVNPDDLELTSELSAAVAGVTRQRDELTEDRDRLARHRDELAAERDRLRQQYADLAYRLDRLEHDRERRERSLIESPTSVLRAVGRSTAPQPRVPAAPARATTRPAAVQTRRRRHPLVGTVLFLLVLLLVAAVLGIVAVGLATHRDPAAVLSEVVQAVLSRTR